MGKFGNSVLVGAGRTTGFGVEMAPCASGICPRNKGMNSAMMAIVNLRQDAITSPVGEFGTWAGRFGIKRGNKSIELETHQQQEPLEQNRTV
jgi:hypothetical protein